MDFYEAINPRTTEITIAGESHTVERARLGRFFRLGELYRKYHETLTERSIRAIEYLFDYLAVSSSIPKEKWENCSPLELGDGFLRLIELNNIRLNLPLFSDSEKREEKVYDYNGRFIATWVARLARIYGWTAEYVLENLFPEETVCYLQEAALQEFDEREFVYSLSELSYRYDKSSKTSKYIPLRKPGWMLERREIKGEKIEIPKRFIPQGVVVDLEEIYRKRKPSPNRG